LKKSGFVEEAVVGLTFPGVDPKKIDAQKKDKVELKKEEVIPDPKMSIGPMTEEGLIKISFNQEMLAPETTLPTNMYKSVFVLSV